MLSSRFEDDWERQGFKRRSDEIEKNKNRLQDFKSTVRLLNFFCDRCKRPGSVTGACDNTKCATLNTLVSTTSDSKKAWSASYNAWKLQRGAKEDKTQDCFAKVHNRPKPIASEIDIDPWKILLANQSVIQPMGSPVGFMSF
jgi:hypothetical protein